MARIVQTKPEPRVPAEPAWRTEVGEDAVTLVLDKNEVVAIRNLVRESHRKVQPNTYSTSLLGAGARVFEALDPLVRERDWH